VRLETKRLVKLRGLRPGKSFLRSEFSIGLYVDSHIQKVIELQEVMNIRKAEQTLKSQLEGPTPERSAFSACNAVSYA
jgi:hypothetical protein